jgi:DNA-binding transcriptional MocR family regulator
VGLNLWARLPDGTDVGQLARNCERAGVIIAAGTEWFPAEPTGPFIRLNYAGPNPGAFPEGTRIIGQELSRALG